MSKLRLMAIAQSVRAIVELKHALEENGVARGPLLSTNTDKNDVRLYCPVKLLAFWVL